MSAAASLILSFAMLAALALFIAGGALIIRNRDRRRGALMIVAGLVIIGNVAIATWPI
jgi:hypothetical protein